jgi:mono/diheme cytochrome c family protein
MMMKQSLSLGRVRALGAAAILSLLLPAAGCGSRISHAESAQEPPAVEQAAASDSTPFKCDPTPTRLDHGRYLVENLAHCFMCHSPVDWKKPGSQPMAGMKGAGFNWGPYGLPFLTAPNITPDARTGAGGWSDQQFARAIREGVGHDGRRLFPVMPYMHFKKMSDEDLASVITYLRSIQPVRNALATTQLPGEIKQSLPPVERVGPVPQPDLSDAVKKGEYLVTLGNCAECHTPSDEKTRQPIAQLALAGGEVMKGPWGEVATANLTPDASGLSYYDEALFLQTIRSGQVKARKLNSIMPWGYFRNMTDDDLKAIYAYLRSLTPVKHVVDNTEPPTYCRICGHTHGYGERN